MPPIWPCLVLALFTCHTIVESLGSMSWIAQEEEGGDWVITVPDGVKVRGPFSRHPFVQVDRTPFMAPESLWALQAQDCVCSNFEGLLHCLVFFQFLGLAPLLRSCFIFGVLCHFKGPVSFRCSTSYFCFHEEPQFDKRWISI